MPRVLDGIRKRYSARFPRALHEAYRLRALRLRVPANDLYIEAFERFVRERPWKQGVAFEQGRAVPGPANNFSGDESFMQVGMYLPPPLLAALEKDYLAAARAHPGLSRAAHLLTAVVWFARREKLETP